jgi:mRNA-degrading endonuclease RelE of RelBE toxin-antitoxin system
VPYEIRIGRSAERDIAGLRAFDRARLYREIREQLTHEPAVETARRKRLVPTTETEAAGITWELRVGAFRVFYDVDDGRVVVLVVKIARKGRKTTREIL